MLKVYHLSFAAFCLVLAVYAARGADAPAPTPIHITGKVVDSKQTPIADAQVSLLSDPATKTVSAKDGTFTLDRADLPDPKSTGTRRSELTIVASKTGMLTSYTATKLSADGMQIPLLPTMPDDKPSAAPPALTFGLYLNDRIAAATPTFDDTIPSQLTTVRPLFDEMGYRCTFYINPGRIASGAADPQHRTTWDQWREVDKAGYEIGNHTVSHYIKPSG